MQDEQSETSRETKTKIYTIIKENMLQRWWVLQFQAGIFQGSKGMSAQLLLRVTGIKEPSSFGPL